MHYVTAENGVVFVKSDKLTQPHGFSTRLGGISMLPHTLSLNLAFGRGDDDSVVFENLCRFTRAVGVDADVVSLPQVHSTTVRIVTEADRGLGYFHPSGGLTADGYVTDIPGLTIGVKTADCVPILLADREAGVIGALHAGWRGTVAGIAREGVAQMHALGASPERIIAAVGPCICSCCFAVGEEFPAAVESAACGALCLPYLFRRAGRLYADLPAMNFSILCEAGLREENIDLSGICTCCDTNSAHFYSHRASGGQRGTMLSVIALPETSETGEQCRG